MKNLNDYVKDNSKFLRLEDGESFTGTYVAFKVTGSKFDPEKDTVIYKLRYEDGKDIFFQTASVAVAKTFAKLKEGSPIKIKREGHGTNTKYHISSPDLPSSSEAQEVEEEIQF